MQGIDFKLLYNSGCRSVEPAERPSLSEILRHLQNGKQLFSFICVNFNRNLLSAHNIVGIRIKPTEIIAKGGPGRPVIVINVK